MISDNLPKNIANELNKHGLTANVINTLTPDHIFIQYCERLNMPLKASDLVTLYDTLRLSAISPNSEASAEFYGIPETRPQLDDSNAMAFALSYMQAEYEHWGKPLTTLLQALRKAFQPYEAPKNTYVSHPDIHTLEINNAAAFFAFNCKKKLFNDEQNAISTSKMFMTIESRANQQYLSSLLSLTEVTQLLIALEETDIPKKTDIAKRATSSVAFEVRPDKNTTLYHNSKQGNHFINLPPLDRLMLKAKCIEVLKIGLNMSRAELYHLIEK